MNKERGPDYLHGLTEMGTPYEAVAEGKAIRCDEKKEGLPPPTEAEKHDAFEWLRTFAMDTQDRTVAHHAYVAFRDWCELKSAVSAKGTTYDLTGYHLVCKECGTIPGDVCLRPSKCPIEIKR